MNHSSKILSQTVAQLCFQKGIEHVVISPGSRNAPLTIEFSNQKNFSCYSIVDERCAAFFALGMAQQLKRPVALVCTSGSALLNYYPAVSEAYYSDIPLVLLTADRPSNLIDIGDGQTIRQENVFANHIEFSANCIEGSEYQPYNENLVNDALNIAIQRSGPIHINLPFSEPLYELVTELTVQVNGTAPNILDRELGDFSEILPLWNTSTRKMILVGTLDPNSLESNYLEHLAEDESILIFTETTSNLHHKKLFPAIDTLISNLSEDAFKKLQPEVLLTFGGMIVSKRIKAFLRKYKPVQHYHVDSKKANDTFFSLTKHYLATPNKFFEAFLPNTKQVSSDYQKYWLQIQTQKFAQQDDFDATVEYSDYYVYKKIFQSLPRNSQLQLANSTAIRYSQLFPSKDSVSVFCNRGTSGIDGSTSTAIGAAVIEKQQTVLVTGDLSFFYDSNALWNAYVPSSFRIILINNSGGGIFRILPKAKDMKHFETYFETRHPLNASKLCEMYNWDYTLATNKKEVLNSLDTFYDVSTNPKLLEIVTPPEMNDKVLYEYFDAILLTEKS